MGGLLNAAPTIVRATLVGPGGDKLTGSCTFVPSAAFKAADGKMVLPATVEVPFQAGDLRIALQPTAGGTPSVTYRGTCNAPPQSVTGTDGKAHKSSGAWGPWVIQVPASNSPVPLDGLVPVPGGGVQVYALSFDADGNLIVPGNVLANGVQLGAGGSGCGIQGTATWAQLEAGTSSCGSITASNTWAQIEAQ